MTKYISILISLLAIGCGNSEKQANPAGTLETTEVDISPALAGRILEVRAKLGDPVNAGDTLVVLDTELITLQRAQAETNHASIAAQRRVFNSQLVQAHENLKLLDITFERTKNLLDAGTAPQQQFDEVKTKRDVATAQAAAIQNQISALDAEESKLDASLSVFDRQLRDGAVVSPISGTVLMRAAEPGEMITPGTIALRVADLSALELRIYLNQKDVDLVKLGQSLAVHVDALEGGSYQGVVSWVSSEAEFTPKNAQTKQARAQLVYAVKLRIENPDRKLHIGMAAEVAL